MLSIVRYICDCLQKYVTWCRFIAAMDYFYSILICFHLRLPISVTTRLLDNFDFILLLVDFIEIKPWQKTLDDGNIFQ